ncbi:DHS-like NAD/FAD-binding domain-containing protein [Xylariaceae sp. FL0662B]|nr:DHS-like NAD/FAD-binding domain-containing protein [Xylariaceae sp. FL0662B]
MPTVQVKPTSSDLLQDVADSLGKARKVVIISGAGISTNSGIPDFRSENGLYSLIQAQFERAEASRTKETTEESADFQISDRPAKRRRTSQTTEIIAEQQEPAKDTRVLDNHRSQDETTEANGDPNDLSTSARDDLSSKEEPLTASEESSRRLTRSQSGLRPPLPRHLTEYSVQSSTSQDSLFSNPQLSRASSQTEDSVNYPAPASLDFSTRTTTPKRVVFGETFSSSPLSSPPPILFDPYENTNTSTDNSSQGSSGASDSSDSEDTQPSFDFLSSQNSTSSLRNMKGRDLFDSNIWADPLKTSVFYRFATTLRQKVREVEPTTTHRFIAQLRDVGKLARLYTQNIDEIEKKIGLSTDLNVGAGNRRRKSAKQQLADLEKDSKENPEPVKAEEDPGGTDTGQSSQNSEGSARSAPRPISLHDKGVECVFLHGSLHSLRCFVCGKLCNWDEDGRESCTLLGEQPECPHCAGATAARQEKGKRALGVGKLRPDIVLYGEEHPQSDLISPIVRHDLSSNPDLLLVLGTSLRVHGLKVMVKEFAKAVHTRGGKVVFINFTKPSESVWGDIIDYWVEWDCDAWVDDLKDRKPHLWLSPEEILEFEKQKREALAEKKRESLSRKREGLGEKRRHTIGASKPRPPPKNPSAMRNDYQCGAYVVWEIFQSLAKIGGRPFDNLGHTPPRPPPSAAPPPVPTPRPATVPKVTPVPPPILPLAATAGYRPIVKTKRARKSAPAAVKASANPDPELKSKPAVKAKFLTNCYTRNQYTKAAHGLARTGKSPTPMRLARLNRAPTPLEKPPASPYEPPSSITAAVKVNPRYRKRKVISDIPYERKASPAVKRSLILPKPLSATRRESIPGSGPAFPAAHDNNTLPPKGPVLPPFQPGWERSPPAKIKPMEPHLNVSPKSPLADVPRPQVTLHARHITYCPMFFSDPLVRLPYETTNYRRPPRQARGGAADDQTTPSPSDQLRWELAQHEALEGAQALEGLRRSG